MTGRALSLVTVDTDLCTWCLGTKGAHHPHCYVGRALAKQAERLAAEPPRKSSLQEYYEHREDHNAKAGL